MAMVNDLSFAEWALIAFSVLLFIIAASTIIAVIAWGVWYFWRPERRRHRKNIRALKRVIKSEKSAHEELRLVARDLAERFGPHHR